MEKAVTSFRGAYDFLSNMYSATFKWDGRTYQNSEAAFQSAKTLDPLERDAFSGMNGVTANRAGKKVALRRDWEDVKVGIMEEVVRAKFGQNPELKERLIATGGMELMEGNNWHDTFWDVNAKTLEGENHLGQILMKLREELGGEECQTRVAEEKEKASEDERNEAEALEAEIMLAETELAALPIYDFAGKEMDTKAFGRVTILRQEGNYLTFEAGGRERTLALPGCVVQGFLIPDDPWIIENCKKCQELEMQLAELRKLRDQRGSKA